MDGYTRHTTTQPGDYLVLNNRLVCALQSMDLYAEWQRAWSRSKRLTAKTFIRRLIRDHQIRGIGPRSPEAVLGLTTPGIRVINFSRYLPTDAQLQQVFDLHPTLHLELNHAQIDILASGLDGGLMGLALSAQITQQQQNRSSRAVWTELVSLAHRIADWWLPPTLSRGE